MKRQRNTTPMKEQTRNTKKEISKLPEKEFRIMTEKISKTLKTKWRKCKNRVKKPRRTKE